MSEPIPVNVCLLLGSENDFPVVEPVLDSYKERSGEIHIDLHVLSCHRNPFETAAFATASHALFSHIDIGIPFDIKNISQYNAIGCIGGKSLQLPGIVDAFAFAALIRKFFPNQVRVFGVALGESGSKSLRAAQDAIEEIPGAPVIMGIGNAAFTGLDGLRSALELVIAGNLPPAKDRKEKPPIWNRWKNY